MKSAGRPGLRVEIDKIHWVPFKFKYDPYININLKLLESKESSLQQL